MNEEKTIKKVADTYHRLLRENNFFPDYNQELEFYDIVSTACRNHLPWEKFILAVETSYFALQYHLRKIIKCEFFYRNYSFWWEEFYTRRQYRAFRQEAVTSFYKNLELTHAINEKGNLNYATN